VSIPLVVAASLLVLVAAAHSYLGERYVLIRLLRRPDLPRLFGGDEFTRRTLRFAWHLTSAAWCGFAVLLVQLGASGGPAAMGLRRTIAVTFGVSAMVSLVGSRGRHLSWVVFGLVALLTWITSS
jgi:hypothetical protein